VADTLFNAIGIDVYFMEYDTERAGGFAPLRFLPRDKMAVLGLVTSKTGALEDKDALRRRIDAATQYVSIDQLALSPQCGFASTEEGNVLTYDQQRAKLALVVEVAQEVWGVS
jgi:5-methyltetrahydropteroyltriglutamate--homocysteine methyltransferase